MKTSYDVIIIGGGAAGMSAALWCDDLQLSALVVEREATLGGQLLRAYNPIKNHLGTEAENGRDLLDTFLRQIENRQFAVRLQAEIAGVDLENKSVALSSGEVVFADAIIVASGVRRRRLGVEGEIDFEGKGIIESGKRDASQAENKYVCVIGGGDAAFENALILAETAASVTLVHRRADFRARTEFIEQVEENSKIQILTETTVVKITGGERVEAVEFENLKTGEIFKKRFEAILIRIGVEPNTGFLRGQVNLDAGGYIKINHICETNVENIYAVGDVANPMAPTVSSAVGMGATAVKAIANFKLKKIFP